MLNRERQETLIYARLDRNIQYVVVQLSGGTLDGQTRPLMHVPLSDTISFPSCIRRGRESILTLNVYDITDVSLYDDRCSLKAAFARTELPKDQHIDTIRR